MKTQKINIIPILKQYNHKANSIMVELFQDCNLQCKFCGNCNNNDQHEYHFDEQKILSMVKDIEQCLPCMVEDGDFGISVLGGELFQDKYNYDVYDVFFEKVNHLIKPYSKARLYTFSNFLFKDAERVYKLLKKHNVYINASFDLVGRYTKPYMIPRVLSNIDFFKTRPIGNQQSLSVCITAHKPNIEAIMNKGQNYEAFERLYNDPLCSIVIGDYLPKKNVPEYSNNSQQLADFYLHLLDKYPKISNFISQQHIEKEDKRCNEIYITQRGVHECYSTLNDKHVFEYKKQFINEMHCLTCDHYAYCSKICYRAMAGMNVCWKKLIYNELNRRKI
jgi:hypothetical protein|nr:MAG TPA: Radical SAM domain protein, CteA SAM binding, metalloprotein, SCIFF [Caudoviricetes sp.]